MVFSVSSLFPPVVSGTPVTITAACPATAAASTGKGATGGCVR